MKGWNVIADLGEGCSKLEYLSLVGNPVTSEFVLCICLFPIVLMLSWKGRAVDRWARKTFQLARSFELVNFI